MTYELISLLADPKIFQVKKIDQLREFLSKGIVAEAFVEGYRDIQLYPTKTTPNTEIRDAYLDFIRSITGNTHERLVPIIGDILSPVQPRLLDPTEYEVVLGALMPLVEHHHVLPVISAIIHECIPPVSLLLRLFAAVSQHATPVHQNLLMEILALPIAFIGQWDAVLEAMPAGPPAVRLAMRLHSDNGLVGPCNAALQANIPTIAASLDIPALSVLLATSDPASVDWAVVGAIIDRVIDGEVTATVDSQALCSAVRFIAQAAGGKPDSPVQGKRARATSPDAIMGRIADQAIIPTAHSITDARRLIARAPVLATLAVLGWTPAPVALDALVAGLTAVFGRQAAEHAHAVTAVCAVLPELGTAVEPAIGTLLGLLGPVTPVDRACAVLDALATVVPASPFSLSPHPLPPWTQAALDLTRSPSAPAAARAVLLLARLAPSHPHTMPMSALRHTLPVLVANIPDDDAQSVAAALGCLCGITPSGVLPTVDTSLQQDVVSAVAEALTPDGLTSRGWARGASSLVTMVGVAAQLRRIAEEASAPMKTADLVRASTDCLAAIVDRVVSEHDHHAVTMVVDRLCTVDLSTLRTRVRPSALASLSPLSAARLQAAVFGAPRTDLTLTNLDSTPALDTVAASFAVFEEAVVGLCDAVWRYDHGLQTALVDRIVVCPRPESLHPVAANSVLSALAFSPTADFPVVLAPGLVSSLLDDAVLRIAPSNGKKAISLIRKALICPARVVSDAAARLVTRTLSHLPPDDAIEILRILPRLADSITKGRVSMRGILAPVAMATAALSAAPALALPAAHVLLCGLSRFRDFADSEAQAVLARGLAALHPVTPLALGWECSQHSGLLDLAVDVGLVPPIVAALFGSASVPAPVEAARRAVTGLEGPIPWEVVRALTAIETTACAAPLGETDLCGFVPLTHAIPTVPSGGELTVVSVLFPYASHKMRDVARAALNAAMASVGSCGSDAASIAASVACASMALTYLTRHGPWEPAEQALVLVSNASDTACQPAGQRLTLLIAEAVTAGTGPWVARVLAGPLGANIERVLAGDSLGLLSPVTLDTLIACPNVRGALVRFITARPELHSAAAPLLLPMVARLPDDADTRGLLQALSDHPHDVMFQGLTQTFVSVADVLARVGSATDLHTAVDQSEDIAHGLLHSLDVTVEDLDICRPRDRVMLWAIAGLVHAPAALAALCSRSGKSLTKILDGPLPKVRWAAADIPLAVPAPAAHPGLLRDVVTAGGVWAVDVLGAVVPDAVAAPYVVTLAHALETGRVVDPYTMLSGAVPAVSRALARLLSEGSTEEVRHGLSAVYVADLSVQHVHANMVAEQKASRFAIIPPLGVDAMTALTRAGAVGLASFALTVLAPYMYRDFNSLSPSSIAQPSCHDALCPSLATIGPSHVAHLTLSPAPVLQTTQLAARRKWMTVLQQFDTSEEAAECSIALGFVAAQGWTPDDGLGCVAALLGSGEPANKARGWDLIAQAVPPLTTLLTDGVGPVMTVLSLPIAQAQATWPGCSVAAHNTRAALTYPAAKAGTAPLTTHIGHVQGLVAACLKAGRPGQALATASRTLRMVSEAVASDADKLTARCKLAASRIPLLDGLDAVRADLAGIQALDQAALPDTMAVLLARLAVLLNDAESSEAVGVAAQASKLVGTLADPDTTLVVLTELLKLHDSRADEGESFFRSTERRTMEAEERLLMEKQRAMTHHGELKSVPKNIRLAVLVDSNLAESNLARIRQTIDTATTDLVESITASMGSHAQLAALSTDRTLAAESATVFIGRALTDLTELPGGVANAIAAALETHGATIPADLLVPLAAVALPRAHSDTVGRRLHQLLVRLCNERPAHLVYPLHCLVDGANVPADQSRHVRVDQAVVGAARAIVQDASSQCPRFSELYGQCVRFVNQVVSLSNTTRDSLADLQGFRALTSRTKAVTLGLGLPTNPAYTMTRLSTECTQLGGLNAPLQVTVNLTDGSRVRVVVKGRGDDLRQSAIIMTLWETLNLRMAKEGLWIPTHTVVPLSPTAGLLEFVEGAATLHEIIISDGAGVDTFIPRGKSKLREAKKALEALNAEQRNKKRTLDKGAMGQRLTDVMRTMPPVLDLVLRGTCRTADVFRSRIKTMRQTIAAGSVACHVFGVGDRHLGNIMISNHGLVHIDMEYAFGQAAHLPIPESVTCRLTPNMLAATGPLGLAGPFMTDLEAATHAARMSKRAVLGVASALAWAPLTKLALAGASGQRVTAMRVRRDIAAALQTDAAVMVQRACNPEELALMFSGWHAFI
ncbi:Serine/Threonine kinase ATM [Carpediemonas membranifera]|uniref:Serine/Threonine kinase ATM n=1 Tax=Carpediemonas membranifera TaxID=201153 RepID=A0A8J6AW43_9EUKA|nr:Serine/Threonine kinase ATM [Carpediemonas membranifera]|eukprot:KAG9389703.1 Serine/Threonine kinase ATM [Carpediemonas membranifera]